MTLKSVKLLGAGRAFILISGAINRVVFWLRSMILPIFSMNTFILSLVIGILSMFWSNDGADSNTLISLLVLCVTTSWAVHIVLVSLMSSVHANHAYFYVVVALISLYVAFVECHFSLQMLPTFGSVSHIDGNAVVLVSSYLAIILMCPGDGSANPFALMFSGWWSKRLAEFDSSVLLDDSYYRNVSTSLMICTFCSPLMFLVIFVDINSPLGCLILTVLSAPFLVSVRVIWITLRLSGAIVLAAIFVICMFDILWSDIIVSQFLSTGFLLVAGGVIAFLDLALVSQAGIFLSSLPFIEWFLVVVGQYLPASELSTISHCQVMGDLIGARNTQIAQQVLEIVQHATSTSKAPVFHFKPVAQTKMLTSTFRPVLFGGENTCIDYLLDGSTYKHARVSDLPKLLKLKDTGGLFAVAQSLVDRAVTPAELGRKFKQNPTDWSSYVSKEGIASAVSNFMSQFHEVCKSDNPFILGRFILDNSFLINSWCTEKGGHNFQVPLGDGQFVGIHRYLNAEFAAVVHDLFRHKDVGPLMRGVFFNDRLSSQDLSSTSAGAFAVVVSASEGSLNGFAMLAGNHFQLGFVPKGMDVAMLHFDVLTSQWTNFSASMKMLHVNGFNGICRNSLFVHPDSTPGCFVFVAKDFDRIVEIFHAFAQAGYVLTSRIPIYVYDSEVLSSLPDALQKRDLLYHDRVSPIDKSSLHSKVERWMALHDAKTGLRMTPKSGLKGLTSLFEPTLVSPRSFNQWAVQKFGGVNSLFNHIDVPPKPAGLEFNSARSLDFVPPSIGPVSAANSNISSSDDLGLTRWVKGLVDISTSPKNRTDLHLLFTEIPV